MWEGETGQIRRRKRRQEAADTRLVALLLRCERVRKGQPRGCEGGVQLRQWRPGVKTKLRVHRDRKGGGGLRMGGRGSACVALLKWRRARSCCETQW